MYTVKIQNVAILRDRIISAFDEIKLEEVCGHAHQSLLRRLQKCVEMQGDVFKHLL